MLEIIYEFVSLICLPVVFSQIFKGQLLSQKKYFPSNREGKLVKQIVLVLFADIVKSTLCLHRVFFYFTEVKI